MSDPDGRPPVVDSGGERPPVVEGRGLWTNARDVFLAPTATFEDVRARPTVAGPLILLVAASAVALAITMVTLAPATEVMDRVLAESGLPGGAWTTVAVTATGIFAIGVTMPLLALVVGGLLWAWSTLRDAESRFSVAVGAVAFSRLVVPIETLVNAGASAAVGRPPPGATLGPALFVEPDAVSPVAYAALMRLDVFSVWIVVLTALAGIHAMRLRRGDAVGFAVALWVAGLALAIVAAAAGGAAPGGSPGAPSL